MQAPGPSWGTFQPCVVRGAEEERQAVRKRSRAALACVALATVALGALAARSAGHAPRAALAQSLAAGHARSATVARASKLWSGRTVPSSADAIAVSEADVDRLGLRAPPGFNVPSVNVTGDDVDRLGLRAPAGFNVPGINVTAEDIDRLGLAAPNGAEIPAMVVTDADMERYGLTPLTAGAGSAGGTVQVTPEDVERYGLVAPSGYGGRLNMNVTADDIAKYGLTNPSISEDEAKELGIFGDGPTVTDDDIAKYGMKLITPTPEEAAALGLGNSTIRLTAEEAEALGLSGPISLTPEEAEALGLSQAAAGNLVTEDDLDRLGLRDPPGWNATGYTHLEDLRRGVALRVAAAKASRSKLQAWQQMMLRAKRSVQQLLDQKRHVARSKAAAAKSAPAKKAKK